MQTSAEARYPGRVAPAWVSALPLQSQRRSLASVSRITGAKQARPVARRARRASATGDASMTENRPTPDTIRLVTVPGEAHMLTPGEVRHVSLDYVLFHTILQSGSTAFGVINIDEWAAHPRGTMLSILNIRNMLPDKSPRVEVECRCSGRFDVDASGEESPPPVWTLLSAECAHVSDWLVYEYADRRALAEREWAVWNGCKDVSLLMRRLRRPGGKAVIVEQELAVWAPKQYDRDLTEAEWAATPMVTRRTYCQRAESFSFGVLRCMQADEHMMARARAMTSTIERLALASECVERKRARTCAELSLKDALN